jgi:hypothetical protein
VPTTLVAPVAEKYGLAAHAPAVPLYVVPTPRPKVTQRPLPLVAPTHVPVVSPAIVIEIVVQVLATGIE